MLLQEFEEVIKNKEIVASILLKLFVLIKDRQLLASIRINIKKNILRVQLKLLIFIVLVKQQNFYYV